MNKEEINRIYKELRVPPHIQRHMKVVADLARRIGEAYIDAGVSVDMNKLINAAYLHDALKICEIDLKSINEANQKDLEIWKDLKSKYNGINHDDAMGEYLEEHGCHGIGDLIRQNHFNRVLNGFSSLEAKILYYADKRVKHDEIVSLEERLRDGRVRYIKSKDQSESTNEIEKVIYTLERDLFSPIEIRPEDLI